MEFPRTRMRTRMDRGRGRGQECGQGWTGSEDEDKGIVEDGEEGECEEEDKDGAKTNIGLHWIQVGNLESIRAH